MGVPNLREFNMSLLAAWSKRFFDDRYSDWKKLLNYKYNVDRPNILWSRTGVGSPFWKNFTWAFSAAKTFYRWILGMGEIFLSGMIPGWVIVHSRLGFGTSL